MRKWLRHKSKKISNKIINVSASRAILRDIADEVGAIAQAQEESWTYAIPELPAPVATISNRSLMVPLCFTVTVAIERRCAVQLRFMMLRGNECFRLTAPKRQSTEKLHLLKGLHGKSTNLNTDFLMRFMLGWQMVPLTIGCFLKPFAEECILDFYHVSEYVADAADVLYAGKTKTAKRQIRLKEDAPQFKA